MTIIKVSNLTKVYKNYKKEEGLMGSIKSIFKRQSFENKAVDSLNFEMEEGEIVGFLGPNGSGKTTTLKMLSGLLYPTEGSAELMGYIPWERDNRFRRQFSIVMGQKNQLWWDLPAIESFNLNKIIYQIEEQQYKKNLQELVDLLELSHLLHVPVRTLSLGERMKMELTGALLHDPKILLLDEPTIGLDLVSQKKIQDFVKYYNETKSTTILLTSHYMSDIENLCPRVILINQGSIVYDGTLEKIKERFSKHKVFKIKFNEETDSSSLKKYGEILNSGLYHVEIKVEKKSAKELSQVVHQNYNFEDISIHESPVEEIMIEAFKIKGDDLNENVL